MTTVAPDPAADSQFPTRAPSDVVASPIDEKAVNPAVHSGGVTQANPGSTSDPTSDATSDWSSAKNASPDSNSDASADASSDASSWDPLRAIAVGTPEPAARFRYDVRTGDWWWSPGMFDLHGLIEGEVEPSTDLVMSHKHPEDLVGTEQTLRRVIATGKPFCRRHRVIDAQGSMREVLSVGEAVLGPDGAVSSVRGYFVDLTAAIAQAVEREQDDAAARRAPVVDQVVEQAKGILVAAFRLTPVAALELLAWRSEETGVDVASVSRGLVAEFSRVDEDDLSAARRACLHLGLTALDED